jgi:hypothetical protein
MGLVGSIARSRKTGKSSEREEGEKCSENDGSSHLVLSSFVDYYLFFLLGKKMKFLIFEERAI